MRPAALAMTTGLLLLLLAPMASASIVIDARDTCRFVPHQGVALGVISHVHEEFAGAGESTRDANRLCYDEGRQEISGVSAPLVEQIVNP
ncbi:MAG TPA: hypothetical protein VM370_02145 [Candidatus Thermoplasmatota archaeon]|nr:hypothetical protein [Candidatus Thermoplasmatota archaeon]